jgi:hypothetical protein
LQQGPEVRREGGRGSELDRREGEGSAFPKISGERRRPPKKKARGSPPADPEKHKKIEEQKIDEDNKKETRERSLMSYFPFDFSYFAPEWVFSACGYGAQQLVLAYQELAQQLVLAYRELAEQCVGAWGVAYAYGIERAQDVSVQVLLSLLALLVQKYLLY